MLRYFMTHPGEVLSQERLLEHVWDENADPFTNTVRVTVGTLAAEVDDRRRGTGARDRRRLRLPPPGRRVTRRSNVAADVAAGTSQRPRGRRSGGREREAPRMQRAAEGLPAWLGSIKVRLAVMYSVVVFGVAAILMAGVYFGLSRALAHQPVTEQQLVLVPSAGSQICYKFGSGFVRCVQGEVTAFEVDNDFKELEKAVNQRALVQFRRYSFAALGGLFVLSLVVGWVLADRALRPIGRISKVAREIQATDLSRRIDLGGPQDEMKDLADTFDGMLERLEAAFESQRQFIHEASHELRNPIAVVRTNVDVALADPDAPTEELRETLQVVGRASARMGVLVDDLLTYARRESPASRESVVDLADVIRRDHRRVRCRRRDPAAPAPRHHPGGPARARGTPSPSSRRWPTSWPTRSGWRPAAPR